MNWTVVVLLRHILEEPHAYIHLLVNVIAERFLEDSVK